MLAQVGNAVPISGWAVTVRFGAGVHHQLAGPGRLDGLGAILGAAVVVVAQAHLGRDGNVRRHRPAHRCHDLPHQLGLVQQHGTAPVLVHGFGGASKVQVNAMRLQLGQSGCVVGQAHRVRAQQLHLDRHAGFGAAAVEQLWRDTNESAARQDRVGHTDEFGHALVHPTHAREHIAQRVVEQPLHGGQHDVHGGPENEDAAFSPACA